jgi:hypothetical protein
VTRVVRTLDENIPEPQSSNWSDFTLLIINESQDIRPDMLKIVHFLITQVYRDRQALRLAYSVIHDSCCTISTPRFGRMAGS